jgi:hypothetical protein
MFQRVRTNECQQPTLNLMEIIGVHQWWVENAVDEALQSCVSVQANFRKTIDLTDSGTAE